MVQCDGTVHYIEVKVAARVQAHQALFDEVATLTAERGASFTVLSDAHIHEQGAHRRAALILRYRKSALAQSAVERIAMAVRAHPLGIAIDRLTQELRVTPQDVYAGLARRRLCADRLHRIEGRDLVFDPTNREHPHEVHIAGWFGTRPWCPKLGSDTTA